LVLDFQRDIQFKTTGRAALLARRNQPALSYRGASLSQSGGREGHRARAVRPVSVYETKR
jgi:hypothetical protein